MKVVWVFNDFDKGISQRDIVMLLASIKLWSIHCPQDKRVLYCSDTVGNAIVSLGMINLLNEVILLPKKSEFLVDSSIFWSYPKLEVLLQQNEPLILVDHDFMVLEDFREEIFNDPKVCYCYTEDAKLYYPNATSSYIQNLTYKTRWPEVSSNVSFLYLPFPEWTQFYAGTSLQIMEELSNQKVPDSRYLIFAEQLVFKHLTSMLSSYRCLVKNVYECRTEAWTEEIDENGLWNVGDCWGKKFIHYGPVKKQWGKQEYEKNLQEICRISGLSLNLIQRTDYLRR